MSEFSLKPTRTDFGYRYREVNIKRVPLAKYAFRFTVDMGFGSEIEMEFKTLAEARRAIDGRIDHRSGAFGTNLTNFEVRHGRVVLRGIPK